MKKWIVILLVLLFSTTLEEARGQQMDTIFTKTGGKIICKIKSMNDFNVKYRLYGKYDTIDGKISADKVVRVGLYANKTLNVEPVTYVSQYKPETERQDAPAIDTLKYLMNQNAYLKSKIADQAVLLGGMSDAIQIGGNRIKNAGMLSIASIITGALSGLAFYGFLTNKDDDASNTYVILGSVTGAISVICSIAVPIELIGAGNKMK